MIEGSGPGDPWIVYPGNSQARSPKPSEQSAKGASSSTSATGVVADAEFVAVRPRPLRGDRMPDRRRRRPPFARRKPRRSGDGRVAAAEDRSVDPPHASHGPGRAARRPRPAGRPRRDLRGLLRGASGIRLPFCWWDELDGRDAGVIDREALRRRGDFAADLLALAEDLRLDPAARAELAAGSSRRRPRLLRRARRDRRRRRAALVRLVEEATTVALDSVAGDEP